MNLKRRSTSFLGLFVLLLMPGLLLAANGKVRGTITDSETGEPLFGANVMIENTTMGAASDMNGEYIILNVPTGKFDVVVTYMGYQKVTIREVIVNANMTTFRDFQMPKVALEGKEVIIVAERPMIDKSETNEVHYMRSEDIEVMPIRGVTAVVSTMAGVVDDGGLHVRGGRNNEMAYYVDGVNASNVFGGDMMVSVISNAIEEVQLQGGGFTAEYGTKMSGVTITTTKTGSPKYSITGEVISDDFWAFKDDAGSHEILGINKLYSFGYNDYVLTAGGPVVPSLKNLRFFAAAQIYNRLSSATWFEGYHQDSIQVTNTFTNNISGAQTKDTAMVYIDEPAGRLPGGGSDGLTFNGNLVYDLKPFRIKVGGSYTRTRSTDETSDPGSMYNIGVRGNRYRSNNYSGYVNVTHAIDPTMFYTLAGSYTKTNSSYGDNQMGWDPEDWMSWGDPAVNSVLLDTSQNWGSYPMPFDPSYTVGQPFGGVAGTFSKSTESKYTAKFDFTKQFGKTHEVRLGGEYITSTYRRFYITALSLLKRERDVAQNPDLYSEYDYYKPIWGGIGYDYLGNEIDEDMIVETKLGQATPVNINLRNAPPKPKTAGFYIQDRIELRDLIINAGLRFDYFDYGHPSLTDLRALEMGPGTVIADSNWAESKKYFYIEPRIGFSFPVTERSVFHAQFGKYVQAPSLSESWTYRSYTDFTEYMYGSVFFAPLQNPNLKPSRTTNYEFGLQMQFGSNASLDLTAFYKDTRDLITYRTYIPLVADYRVQTFFSNGDFGTVKGFTATFNLRRTARIQAQMAYTYSVAEGTGSASGEHADIAWQEENPHFPRIISALAFDQRHKGTLAIDARTMSTDGPEVLGLRPLANIGLNLLFDFHSGSPFTRIAAGDAISDVYGYNAPAPIEPYNASTLPWFYELSGKLDKSFIIGPVKLTAYLWGINFLNLKSIVDGSRITGRPDSDGWLQTDAGKDRYNSIMETYGKETADQWANWYTANLSNCGTFGYQQPRQIRFGFKFEL